MKILSGRKLALNKQTLRILTGANLRRVAGGGGGDSDGCETLTSNSVQNCSMSTCGTEPTTGCLGETEGCGEDTRGHCEPQSVLNCTGTELNCNY